MKRLNATAAVLSLLGGLLLVPGMPLALTGPLAVLALIVAPGLVAVSLIGERDRVRACAVVAAVGGSVVVLGSLPLHYLDVWSPAAQVAVIGLPTLLLATLAARLQVAS